MLEFNNKDNFVPVIILVILKGLNTKVTYIITLLLITLKLHNYNKKASVDILYIL